MVSTLDWTQHSHSPPCLEKGVQHCQNNGFTSDTQKRRGFLAQLDEARACAINDPVTNYWETPFSHSSNRGDRYFIPYMY